jgi:hypothetical protein
VQAQAIFKTHAAITQQIIENPAHGEHGRSAIDVTTRYRLLVHFATGL